MSSDPTNLVDRILTQLGASYLLVEAILAEEEVRFLDFLRSLDMLPLITDMRQQAEELRQAELKKTLRRLPDLTDTERACIDAMTQALVKKLLENPTNHLRAEAASPHAPEIASLTRTLFNLQSEQALHNFSGETLSTFSAAD